MKNNIIEGPCSSGAEHFSPNEFVQELLDHLSAEKAQSILEHAWNDFPQIFHHVIIALHVAWILIAERGLDDLGKAHFLQGAPIYGVVGYYFGIFVNPLFEGMKNIVESTFERAITVVERFAGS